MSANGTQDAYDSESEGEQGQDDSGHTEEGSDYGYGLGSDGYERVDYDDASYDGYEDGGYESEGYSDYYNSDYGSWSDSDDGYYS